MKTSNKNSVILETKPNDVFSRFFYPTLLLLYICLSNIGRNNVGKGVIFSDHRNDDLEDH